MMHGGDLVASVLHRHNVKWIFTLCGGHISPILTACKEIGILRNLVTLKVIVPFSVYPIPKLKNISIFGTFFYFFNRLPKSFH